MNPAECEELPTALQLYGQLPNLYKAGDSNGILNLLQSCIGKDRFDILFVKVISYNSNIDPDIMNKSGLVFFIQYKISR